MDKQVDTSRKSWQIVTFVALALAISYGIAFRDDTVAIFEGAKRAKPQGPVLEYASTVRAARDESKPATNSRPSPAVPRALEAPPPFVPTNSALADEQALARFASLEAAAKAEPVDASWAKGAQEALRTAYIANDTALTSADVNVSCRATLCRVTVQFPDTASIEIGVRRLLHARPWASPAFSRVDPSSGLMTQFVARDGHKLPSSPLQMN